MRQGVLVLTALLVWTPGALRAQEPAPAWPGLHRSALSTVFVLDDAGVETKGQLLRLDPEAIVVLVDGAERRFDTRRVTRVSKPGDSLRNGALIGLIVGLGQSALSAALRHCRSTTNCLGEEAIWTLDAVIFYTVVGTGIDAAYQGRTVMYQAPAPHTVVQLRPGGLSTSVRLTW